MNVGSLFSGIGGIELGFEREGFETRWFVENNPYCQEVLKQHFPKATIYGDITKLDFSKLEQVEVLTGGFPCQDISVAGYKMGIKEGKRSSLWQYYKEAIRVLRPEYAVIENVPNLINLGLDTVLANLAEIGYNAEWFCLSASQVGAPHRRERIFIIAYPSSERRNGSRDNREGRQLLQAQERSLEEDKQSRSGRLIGIDKNPEIRTANATSQRFDGRSKEGLGQKEDDAKVQGRGIQNFITNDWGERIQRFEQETIQGKQGFSWCKDVGRIEELFNRPDIPQPLIRGTGNGLPRGMDSYTRTERTKAIGNAVVPQVAQFIARRIKEMNFY